MDIGRVVATDTPYAVVHHPQVVASYLGNTDEVIQRSGAKTAPARPARKRTTKAATTAARR